MNYEFQQLNFNAFEPKKSNKKKILFIISLVVLGYIFFNLGHASNLITAENQPRWQKITGFFRASLPISSNWQEKEILDKNFPLPKKEVGRWDILILGIRGTDDPDGGLLSDSIMLFSLDKKTGQSSLTSIPRDLYVGLPGMVKGKANEIYERGLLKKKAREFSEEAFSRLTGVHIDNIIVFDFQAFKEIVDDLGGIDVTLKKPFEEKNQWGYEFSLPAGLNHLNGQEALYFVRSRYSTSDFDRSLRQQQMILAIKDKAFNAKILANPLQLASILNSIRKNVVTDLNIFDTNLLVKLTDSFGAEKSKPTLGHLSTENILDQTFQDNIYILLPKNNDWDLFREYFQKSLAAGN